MFITMHCGGLPFNGNTIKEKSLGGSETAAYYMAKELASKGHKVTLFTNSQDEGVFDGVRYVFAGQAGQHHPLGQRFHQYASSTPVDVLIIQRAPSAFLNSFEAKIKLLWLHDLATPNFKDAIKPSMLNIDGILTVSEMHKEQVVKVYGVNPDIVFPIQNGVDLELFKNDLDIGSADDAYQLNVPNQFKLLYTSRPERGLEHLVAPNGIMERLLKERPDAHLYVCGYENTTPQMQDYYYDLWQRCKDLPNVTNLGALTKQELADVMRQVDLLVYPTPSPVQPDFKEVSCITVMEAMAAGLPMLTCNVGALPETAKGSGTKLLDLKDGQPDIDAFTKAIVAFSDSDAEEHELLQLEASTKFAWSNAATMVEDIVKDIFDTASVTSKLRELIHLSDIKAARMLIDKITDVRALNEIELRCKKEIDDCYSFFINDDFDNHYYNMYVREDDRGVKYGAENLNKSPRFEAVAMQIARLPEGATVMDYGCAHGHYTMNLAMRFPKLNFIGVDITESNIAKANKWREDVKQENVKFYYSRVDIEQQFIIDKSTDNVKEVNGDNYQLALDNLIGNEFDAIIAAQVIEHVADPIEMVDVLRTYLKDKGLMIITTPYGGWEAIGYEEHHPWRAHIHHFEREDLHDVWGNNEDFNIICVPSGKDNKGYNIGSYVTVFKETGAPSHVIDYERKFATMLPKQTVSLCMIVKDAETTLLRTLESVKGVVDEIIISLDKTTTDRTREVIGNFIDDLNLWPVVTVKDMESAINTGFSEARNFSIKGACADWIMWLDSDEVLNYGERITPYLQHNQFKGYAVKQHHVSAEPLGILKTDLPVRLFRNNIGVTFFGVVHEHPEIEMNKGVGVAVVLPDVDILHSGYTNEAIRRGRFDRNIDLMAKDREVNPDRLLGKFLWLRDIAQMTRYELQAGQPINPLMVERCKEGVRMFEELLEAKQLRMLTDGMQWYSVCAGVLGAKFQAAFTLDTGLVNQEFKPQGKTISAMFLTKEHATKLFNALLNEKVKDYEETY